MKISIITVCYNSDKTIKKTFESIKNQTYKDFEFIVIDGGSKDKTLKICQEYKDIIDVLVSEKDDGLYDAMNKGIMNATGDYIGILNSDDIFYDENTIKDIQSFLEKNESLDACVGDVVQNKNGRIIRKYSSKNWSPEKLKIGFMPPHPSIFFKRNLFEKFGFYRLGYKIAADYELIIRFFLKHKISYKYSNIITTSMLVGGASSSGYSSYKIITKEIAKGFNDNKIDFSPIKVKYRLLWKILDYILKK